MLFYRRKPVPLMLRSVTAFKSSVKENENIDKVYSNPPILLFSKR